jgi:hypothetical protein
MKSQQEVSDFELEKNALIYSRAGIWVDRK